MWRRCRPPGREGSGSPTAFRQRATTLPAEVRRRPAPASRPRASSRPCRSPGRARIEAVVVPEQAGSAAARAHAREDGGGRALGLARRQGAVVRLLQRPVHDRHGQLDQVERSLLGERVGAEGEGTAAAEAFVLGEGETRVVAEPRPLQQRQCLVIQAAKVVVADPVHLGSGLLREQRAVLDQRFETEAVGVVAVQADLAPVPGEQRERLGNAPAVRLRLVAVLPVRVAGDDEEGGRDAAGVLAAEELGERPVGIGAPREMTDEPVAGVAELAARGGPVAAVDAARRPVPRGGEPAPRPAPEIVQVVRERDREPMSPHIQPGCGKGLSPRVTRRGARTARRSST